MFQLKVLLIILLCFIALPTQAQDMKAEQSALLHDLLAPYQDAEKIPENSNPKVFKKAVSILKEEKLIGSGRPNFKEKGLLDKYGKALFLGNRAKKFAKEIGHINDLVDKGDKVELEKALSDLWVKAGRKKPDAKALAPVLDSLYGARGAEPQETINHIYEKPGHRVEVVHAKAGGRMQVNVIEINDKGEEVSRTVISGTTKTTPSEDNSELQRTIKPEKACTNTAKTDKKNFKLLKGEWISNSGSIWTISGKANNLILTDGRGANETTLKYKGMYHLGQIKAKHMITSADDIANSLPLAIRTQLANKGHSFRVYLESCNDQKDLSGTWSSQHVTYNGGFMTVKRVHDPYDLSLILNRKGAKKEKPDTFFIQDIDLQYEVYQERLKKYIKALTEKENEIGKKQVAEYKEKREQSIKIKALQRGHKRLQKELKEASKSEVNGIIYEIKNLEHEIDGHRLAVLSHEAKGDKYGTQWLAYRHKKEKLEELASFDSTNLPSGRPILESLKVSAGGKTVFNSTHKLDPKIIAPMKGLIKAFRLKIADFDIQSDNIRRNIRWSNARRNDEIDRATIQNKKVQKAFNELGENIQSEANTRVLLNTLADIAEIAVDGVKAGNPGASLATALGKLGEAYFVTGMGKGVTMYDPGKLMAEYNDKGKRLTSHADDPYTADKWNTAKGQFKRSLYGATKEALLGANAVKNYNAKKIVQEALMESIRKGKVKAQNEMLSANSSLSSIIDTLSKQDKGLSEALKQMPALAEKTAIKNQQKIIRKELAEHTAERLARIGSAHLINRNMEEMSEKLVKETVKEALYETVPQKALGKVGEGFKNVGQGIAWDALRGAIQTGLDFHAEDQWKDYLNTLFIADVIHKQLIYTNKEIASFENDLKIIADQKAIYEFKLAVAKSIYREYLEEKLVGETLYKTSSKFKEKEVPIDVYLDPIGSTHGEKVFLEGDLEKVQLIYMDKNTFAESPEYNTDMFTLLDYELSSEVLKGKDNSQKWRPNRKWHYQLPAGKKLSDISSTGELSLVVEVR